MSGNFLASKYIRNHELPQLLRAKDQRGVRFLWLHLSPSIWDEVKVGERKPFHELQAVWPPEPSLLELGGHEQEKALVQTAKAVVSLMGG